MKQAMVKLASMLRKPDRHFGTGRQFDVALFVKFAPIFTLLGSISLSVAYGTRLALCRGVRAISSRAEREVKAKYRGEIAWL